jgi:S1-C subfamily serine protease
VRRAWLGLVAQNRPLDATRGRRLAIAAPTVVETVSVEPDGPAAAAGLRAGDWILAIGGQPTPTVDELHRRLTAVAIGAPVAIKVLRGADRIEVAVTPRETP